MLMFECPVCFDTTIEKAIMAPRLSSTTRKKGLEYETPMTTGSNQNNLKTNMDKGKASQVAREFLETANKIQKHVEENCENVGENFAD